MLSEHVKFLHSISKSSRICSALLGMLVGGGDERLGEKVGPVGEPTVKWIGSGLESGAAMTAYWPESALRG